MSESQRELYGINSAEAIEALKSPGCILDVLAREIEVHQQLHHPNVAGAFFHIFDSANLIWPWLQVRMGSSQQWNTESSIPCGVCRHDPNRVRSIFTLCASYASIPHSHSFVICFSSDYPLPSSLLGTSTLLVVSTSSTMITSPCLSPPARRASCLCTMSEI